MPEHGLFWRLVARDATFGALDKVATRDYGAGVQLGVGCAGYLSRGGD